MTARYVVMPVAEARASGKKAAGFDDARSAEATCDDLARRTLDAKFLRWTIEEGDVAAIVDTATAADERREAEWSDPGPLVIRDLIELHADHSEWRVCNVYGDNHAHGGEGMGIGANRRAAESAAASLLVSALLALGETGREAMRKAMEKK